MSELEAIWKQAWSELYPSLKAYWKSQGYATYPSEHDGVMILEGLEIFTGQVLKGTHEKLEKHEIIAPVDPETPD